MFAGIGMTSRSLNVLCWLMLVMALSAPAGAQIGGPTLGYVYDPAASGIRIVHGIPGAAALGDIVPLDQRLARVAISLKGDYALAAVEGSSEVVLVRNLSSGAEVVALPYVHPGADLIEISPGGNSAVIFAAERSRIQVIGGLPLYPTVRFEFDPSAAQQPLTALAVSDQEAVLAAFSDGSNGSLYLFSADGSSHLVSPVQRGTSVAFSTDGTQAALADAGSNEVLGFQNISTVATRIQIGSEAGGVVEPTTVRFSADGATVYVANRGTRSVSVLQMSGQNPLTLKCDCDPKLFHALRANSYVLTDSPGEPLVVFDAGDVEPRFIVIPPSQSPVLQ